MFFFCFSFVINFLSSSFTAFARTYCVDSNGVPLDDVILDAEEEEEMKQKETNGKGGGKDGKSKSGKGKSGGESKSSGKRR